MTSRTVTDHVYTALCCKKMVDRERTLVRSIKASIYDIESLAYQCRPSTGCKKTRL